MEYTQKYYELKAIFNPGLKEIIIPGSQIRILNLNFRSDTLVNDIVNKQDIAVAENTTFTYPVFIPTKPDSKKVILLLHGLNERSWDKYLTWAYYLSVLTECYVVLFPISFHINRSPDSWKDPRIMINFLNQRRNDFNKINMASMANIALSNRLTEDPLRFFNSGHQTATDIVKLMHLIKDGRHEIIPGGSKVNVFAYSIGAFLAQIMCMGNPDNLFTDSKLFMFCGGSVFSNMQGTSRLIMDSLAYEKVYNFYMTDFESETRLKSPLAEVLKFDKLGMAFRSMIDFSRLKRFRENTFKQIKDQIFSIALLKDKVIPFGGIVETMRAQKVEVWDFPHEYSHENPFPFFPGMESGKVVDASFERLITAAGLFLA